MARWINQVAVFVLWSSALLFMEHLMPTMGRPLEALSQQAPEAAAMQEPEGAHAHARAGGRRLLASVYSGLPLNETVSTTIVRRFNSCSLNYGMGAKFGPTVTARAIAIVHTCVYEAWSQYDDVALGTVIRRQYAQAAADKTFANKVTAMVYAAAICIRTMFSFDNGCSDKEVPLLLGDFGLDPDIETITSVTGTPAWVGAQAAYAILSVRKDDGSNQENNYIDNSGYQPVNTPDVVKDPNRWQPLLISDKVQKFQTPQWGFVTGFSMNTAYLATLKSKLSSATPLSNPPPFADSKLCPPNGTLMAGAVDNSREFRGQINELIQFTSNLTDYMKCVAEYWADGPPTVQPPGHWMAIANIVAVRDKLDSFQHAKLMFLMGNAMLDASIASWYMKRSFDSVRPITIIRTFFKGKALMGWKGKGAGSGPIKGENWIPYQKPGSITPAFAEYPSGHSTFSGAAQKVLEAFTGSTAFKAGFLYRAGTATIDSNTPSKDVELYWNTFQDAAFQAGWSRRYAGIHFLRGDVAGRYLGRVIGVRVYAEYVKWVQGTHA